MSDTDLILENGDVVQPGGVTRADVVVRDGLIAEIREAGTAGDVPGTRVDATGLIVLPGGVDGHVHFIQDDPDLFGPDPDEFEGFEFGGRGAASGGVTTVIEMPQSRPPTTDGAT